MLCVCTHGTDRHYVDYGYGVGCWFGKCLEPGCKCLHFQESQVRIWPTQVRIWPTQVQIWPTHTIIQR